EKEAELGFPQLHTFKDKTKGIMVPVNLGTKLFPNGLPAQLNMEITLSSELRMAWEIDEVQGYIDEGNGKQRRMDFQPVVLSDQSESEKTTVLLDGLISKDKRYILKAYLHGRDKA